MSCASHLTRSDLDLILTSLEFTRQKFESYSYPSPDFRQQRLEDLASARSKVQDLRKGASA